MWCVVVPAVSFYFAAPHLPAGVLSITVTVGPILTFLFSAFVGLDLNQGVRRLLDCDLEEIPTTVRVLTFEIDKRLARPVNLLNGEDEDKPPVKAVQE